MKRHQKIRKLVAEAEKGVTKIEGSLIKADQIQGAFIDFPILSVIKFKAEDCRELIKELKDELEKEEQLRLEDEK